MNNEELKKKIAQIIADYFCPQKNEHKNLCGDDRLCYSKMNFAECERVTECTDALIAEMVRDIVKIAREIGVSATAMAVFEAEKAKHRAEVAERALYNLAKEFVDMQGYEKWDIAILAKEIVVPDYIKQAEKELSEEKK